MARVVVPTCVIYAYSIIIPIVKWDIFEDLAVDPKTWLKENNASTQGFGIYQQMQLLGYTTNETLKNLGSITIFFIVYALKIAFLAVLKMIRNLYGNNHKFQSVYTSLKKSLFFYEFFMIIIEPYIEYLIAGYMQFGYEYQNLPVPKAAETTITTSSMVVEERSSSTSDGFRRFLFQTEAVNNQV
jgi:hypothetical protein